jgi:2-methylaconitate cis-trans-isomerase PrpF
MAGTAERASAVRQAPPRSAISAGSFGWERAYSHARVARRCILSENRHSADRRPTVDSHAEERGLFTHDVGTARVAKEALLPRHLRAEAARSVAVADHVEGDRHSAAPPQRKVASEPRSRLESAGHQHPETATRRVENLSGGRKTCMLVVQTHWALLETGALRCCAGGSTSPSLRSKRALAIAAAG